MQKLLNALLYSLREKCPNTVNLRIQSKYRKIRARKNSVFGHFAVTAAPIKLYVLID